MDYNVEKLPNHNLKFSGGDITEFADVILYNGDFFAGLSLNGDEDSLGHPVTVDLILANSQGDVESDSEAIQDFVDSCQQVCITNPNVHRSAASAWTNAAEMLTILAAECRARAKAAEEDGQGSVKSKTKR